MLWKNLQIYYPDPSTFVPGIAQVIIMWCDAMAAWLESDDNEDQVDKMLDGLKARGKLDIAIEVCTQTKLPCELGSVDEQRRFLDRLKYQPQHGSLTNWYS
jgi:hypothetical protein